MKLSSICKDIEFHLLRGSCDMEVEDIIYDSRKVKAGTVFVAMVGAVTDGHKYIEDAVAKGATAVVLENDEKASELPSDVAVLKVSNAREALALMSAAFFDYPAKKLTTVGLTGTKGKTTSTYIIRDVLSRSGENAGLIGTIEVITGEDRRAAEHTTPESYELQKYMAEMVESGCKYMVMEVSSQGIKLDRTAGIEFDYGVFTNLSPDHIGPTEHKDFDEYLECKSRLFRQCRTGIVNIDDEHSEAILKGHTCRVVTYSTEREADLRADNIEFLMENGRLGMTFDTEGMMNRRAMIHIPGRFSVYNALTTIAVCKELDVSDDNVLAGLEEIQVRGRVEPVKVSDKFSVIIDFAHNEFSMRSVLTTLKEYHPKRLICVFGCGGNRSRERRYGMGEVAGEMADLSILTTDNLRFESFEDICADIKIGIARHQGKYIEIEDRKEALAYAICNAEPGDMVVALGKGHEEYIETKGVKCHFSELEAIGEIVEEIKNGKRTAKNV